MKELKCETFTKTASALVGLDQLKAVGVGALVNQGIKSAMKRLIADKLNKFLRLAFFAALMPIVQGCGNLAQKTFEKPQDHFIRLAFQDYTLPQTIFPYSANETLLFRRHSTYAIVGNRADVYKKDIERAMDFLSPHFSFKQVNPNENPDLYINVHAAIGPSDESPMIARANYHNQVVLARSGYHTIVQNRLSMPLVSHQFRPYTSENFPEFMRKDSICKSSSHFENRESDLAAWGVTPAPYNVTVQRIFDYSVIDIVTGFTNSYPNQDAKPEYLHDDGQQPFVYTCAIEEIIHAVAFWRDVYDANRSAFSLFTAARGRGTFEDFHDGFKKDMPELREMIGYYSLGGMQPGLSKSEVMSILRAHE